jgi:hypothetical protein
MHLQRGQPNEVLKCKVKIVWVRTAKNRDNDGTHNKSVRRSYPDIPFSRKMQPVRKQIKKVS